MFRNVSGTGPREREPELQPFFFFQCSPPWQGNADANSFLADGGFAFVTVHLHVNVEFVPFSLDLHLL